MYEYTDRNGNVIDLRGTDCDPAICDTLADDRAVCPLDVEMLRPFAAAWPVSGRRSDTRDIARILREHGAEGGDAVRFLEERVKLPAPPESRVAMIADAVRQRDEIIARQDLHDDDRNFGAGLKTLTIAALDYRTPTNRHVVYAWLRLNRPAIDAICLSVAGEIIASRAA